MFSCLFAKVKVLSKSFQSVLLFHLFLHSSKVIPSSKLLLKIGCFVPNTLLSHTEVRGVRLDHPHFLLVLFDYFFFSRYYNKLIRTVGGLASRLVERSCHLGALRGRSGQCLVFLTFSGVQGTLNVGDQIINTLLVLDVPGGLRKFRLRHWLLMLLWRNISNVVITIFVVFD